MVAGVMAGMEKLDKDMNRRCSHCSHNGHNARTCPDRGIKLFGVRLTEGMRKSVSMGNLSHYGGSNNQASTPEHSELGGGVADGYMSDGLVQTSSNARERKKGVPWTEEEHRLFLIGLQKLGKGDWRGIARNFVTTRTPTQVASHAQKYFIRQCNLNRKKRRSSLFDIAPEPDAIVNDELMGMVADASIPVHQLGAIMSPGQSTDAGDSQGVGISPGPLSSSTIASPISITELVLGSVPTVQTGVKANNVTGYDYEASANLPGHLVEPSCITSLNVSIPTLVPVPLPFPVPLWVGTGHQMFSHLGDPTRPTSSNIVKPTPTLSTARLWINTDPELPHLSLGISPPSSEPSSLNLNLEQSSRQSAFHSKTTFNGSNSATREGMKAAIISVV